MDWQQHKPKEKRKERKKPEQSSSMVNVFAANTILSSQTPHCCRNFEIHFQETRKHLNVKHTKWIMNHWLSFDFDKAFCLLTELVK